MRTGLPIVLVLLVAACGSATAVALASPSPLSVQQLAERPLKFPAVAAGQPCPTTAITLLGGTAPRLGKPVGFGFGVRADGSPWPTGNYALNKTVWDSSGLPWNMTALVRGAQLDGSGTLYFGGNGISNPEPSRVTVADAGGSRILFYPELRLPVDSSAAFYLYPTTVGCFAMQVDSNSFSEVVVFRAV
ncbi:MAG TPA: hypothetical protein VLR46_14930 [Candidatus Dormibacteraeota bacterium]|nr:hypothetical protein [Candidatus Dormibacteraeota bacterium]